MKRLLLTHIMVVFAVCAFAQDVNVLLKEAENLEKQLKESAALDKYKQAALVDPTNIKALVKCAELNAAIGMRQTDKNSRNLYYLNCSDYAQKALAADSNSADANYAMAMACGKMTEVETDKRKMVDFVRRIKQYSDKALQLNPNHAKANYTAGKWHLEVLDLSWFKKAAIKTMYGGLAKPDIDTAIAYMEKCRSLDMYFAANYLDLAKAYKIKNRPTPMFEVLNKLVKLPTRTENDVAIKEEGKKMLAEEQ
ncbi:hypothetical protein [Foetidibacter luteolus]|uniref:hypothetical protein n=1 Tax=Foetidibacter luteolus TaxID=2608880 RepID=UPI00129A88EA|nr:hypothetical protein [Foetidibacter luteolus]